MGTWGSGLGEGDAITAPGLGGEPIGPVEDSGVATARGE